jgi:murein DD-endopeptidase MepM/ murein hydrolase activator NlpD
VKFRSALLAAAVGIAALAFGQPLGAIATTSSPCSGQTGAASSARVCSGGDPSQQLLQLEQRLGGDVAQALATQQKISQAVNNAAATEVALSTEVSIDEARVADLQDQIARLDAQISSLQTRIGLERGQVAALARAMYQRPTSFLDIIASSGSVSEMLSRTADALVAGERAHSLEDTLKSNLEQAQADRDARQSDLDQENATLQQVQTGLEQLSGVQTELDSLSGQAVTLIAEIRGAFAKLNDVAPDVTASLASLLEAQEQNLANQEQAAAWAQASVGAGLAGDQKLLPTGAGPAGAGPRMAWPMRGGVITQPFGPTSFLLEPPLGPYPHFHTGIDIAAPLGTPVLAAAAGVVIVVGHSPVGYGNFVIIAHGYGVLTLYGHLLETDVFQGQVVTQGEMVGKEGMTGFATGPHVHFEVRLNGQVVDPVKFLPPI